MEFLAGFCLGYIAADLLFRARLRRLLRRFDELSGGGRDV